MADRLNKNPIRVMVVEDSMTSLGMLLHALAQEEDIVVAGVAKNGKEAIESVAEVRPDIILMDINMPLINGYEASRTIMEEYPVPIILMTATWSLEEVHPILKSMDLGVLGVYEKPYGPGHPRYRELLDEITTALRVLSDVRVVRRWRLKPGERTTTPKLKDVRRCNIVLIGASTGGPPAIHTILKALPHDFTLPILIAQHMSSEFIDSFIEWLDGMCRVTVKRAENGEVVRGACAYVAPPQHHMLYKGGRIRLVRAGSEELNVPSIAMLFSSFVDFGAEKTVAVLLSGMGDDGAAEMAELRKRGALTIAQDEASSVVFGIVKEAIRRDGVEFVLPPEGIVRMLLEMGSSDRKECR